MNAHILKRVGFQVKELKMDIPPRIPTRTSEHATQQVDGPHQTTGNATANTTRNNAAGPLPRAAGNLGQTVQSEVGQQVNVSANRRQLRVSIDETANITFDIPTRKDKLVDILTIMRYRVSQAIEQNLGNLNEDQRETSQLSITAIDLLLTKIQGDGHNSREEITTLKKETLYLVKIAKDLVKAATSAPAPEPAQGVDAAPRLPTRR